MAEPTVMKNVHAGRLAGRRILITGAASGIGRATAQLFAQEGAKVALLDVDASAVEAAALECSGVAISADLRNVQAVVDAVGRSARAMGGLDGVVNCAGVVITRSLEETSVEEWQRVLAVNLTGPYLVCKTALPWLREAKGTIVNVASGAGVLPNGPNSTAYSGSKGGLIAFTKALAAELAPAVRANVVCPGLTRTPMTEFLFAGYDHDISAAPAVASYALKRPAEATEIANACLFLTSSESSYVTGATLAADGGRTFH